MASRDMHPMKRTAREEARIWPIALVLVAFYLLAAHWFEPAPDDRTTTWQIKEGE